jgi:O-antigen/teichoic acid export membrane protein
MSFLGDVSKLSSGTFGAQLMAFAATPVLTRIFAPEAFGTAGFVATLAGIIGGVACLRYDPAIVLPEEDATAANLYAGSVMSALAVALFTAGLILVAADAVQTVLHAPGIGPYLWLVPPMVLFAGLNHASTYWTIRTKQFGRLSISKVIDTVVKIALQLGLGLCGWISGGILILGAAAGQALATGFLCARIWRLDGRLLKNAIRPSRIKRALQRYIKFPKFVIGSGLLVDASLKLPVFFIAYFFSARELGYFVLVQLVLRIPLNLVGQSISSVFFQRAAELKTDPQRLAARVVELYTFLNAFIILPALVLAFFGDDLVAFVFGAGWAEAGTYLQIIVFAALIEFVTAPLGPLFNVLEKQKAALGFNVLLMAARAAALAAGGLTGDIRLALALYVLCDIVARSVKFRYIFRQVGIPLMTLARVSCRKLLWGLPFLIGLVLPARLLDPHPFLLVALIVLFTAANQGLHFYKPGKGDRSRTAPGRYFRSIVNDRGHR